MANPEPTPRPPPHPAEVPPRDPPPAQPGKDPTPTKPSKPRTLAEARARQSPQSRLNGEKSHQDGGVRRDNLVSSLNAQATPFGAYDAAIISAIQNRWYDLLEDRLYAEDRKGKVTLKFHLNSDGSITQMTLMQNSVDITLALLCESAIRDPAPYKAWPDEMRRLIGANYREVTFTFYYR